MVVGTGVVGGGCVLLVGAGVVTVGDVVETGGCCWCGGWVLLVCLMGAEVVVVSAALVVVRVQL